MSGAVEPRVDVDAPEAFLAELEEVSARLPKRIDADAESIDVGLARLVLTLMELIRQVLEHQAIRRMEGGLPPADVERVGLALLRLEERLEEVKAVFGLDGEELNIDLGPLGRLL